MKSLRGAAVLLVLAAAAVLALSACSGKGGDGPGGTMPRAPGEAATPAPAAKPTPTLEPTPAPEVPAGWERFDEGDFGGYMSAGSIPIYLRAGDFADAAPVLDRLDESGQRVLEAAMETIADSDFFFLFLGSEVEVGSNVNILACEVSGQPIGGENQVKLGYLFLGLEVEEVGEVVYGGKSATIFKPDMSDEFETYQVVLEGGECNLLVTLTLFPGGYEGFASSFVEFIQLLEFRGGPATE